MGALRGYLAAEVCADHDARPCELGLRTIKAAERGFLEWMISAPVIEALAEEMYAYSTLYQAWSSLPEVTQDFYRKRIVSMITKILENEDIELE